jgi:hypothetical protein
MGRLGLGGFAALIAIGAAHGQESPPGAQGRQVPALDDGHCAAMGEGFFAVAGSSACMRISGHVSAGVGFGTVTVGARLVSPATGAATDVGVSGDMRFDTPMGPGRVYVDVHDASGSRWLIDGQ